MGEVPHRAGTDDKSGRASSSALQWPIGGSMDVAVTDVAALDLPALD